MDIIYYSLVDVYYTLLFYSFLFFSMLFYSILHPGLAPWSQNWPHDIKIGVLWLLVNVFHFTVYYFIIDEIRKIDNDFELNWINIDLNWIITLLPSVELLKPELNWFQNWSNLQSYWTAPTLNWLHLMFEEVYTRPTSVDSVGLHVDFFYWFPSFREASLKTICIRALHK